MFTAIAITALVAFAAGVTFHKYVVSEAAAVKNHVTLELSAAKTATPEIMSGIRRKRPSIM